MPAVLACRKCGSRNVHHSRLRTWFERLWWRFSDRAPFRCHDCDWRAWLADPGPRTNGGMIREIHRDLSEAELERLDPDRH